MGDSLQAPFAAQLKPHRLPPLGAIHQHIEQSGMPVQRGRCDDLYLRMLFANPPYNCRQIALQMSPRVRK